MVEQNRARGSAQLGEGLTQGIPTHKDLEFRVDGKDKPLRHLWSAASICLRQTSEALRQQVLLPRVEEA